MTMTDLFTPAAHTDDERIEMVLAFLDKAGVGYELFLHPAIGGMDECAAIGEALGAYHCKNLFLANRSGRVFALALIGRNKRFRTSVVSKELGMPRLGFASAEQLYEKLGLTPGSISITGLMNAAPGSVRAACDADILKEERMLIHPNTNTASLLIKTADLTRIAEALGFTLETIEVADETAD